MILVIATRPEAGVGIGAYTLGIGWKPKGPMHLPSSQSAAGSNNQRMAQREHHILATLLLEAFNGREEQVLGPRLTRGNIW